MPKGQSFKPLEEVLSQEKVSISFDGNQVGEFPVRKIEPSPCMAACPAGVNVKAYVSLIASGRFGEALDVVRKRNPFPGICGRVCTHPCEAYCNRGQVDAPVAICWLKRFVADYELKHPELEPKPITQSRPEKIAIIGSGPAGLTAANDLIRKGYGVTVFEALPTPGGMLVAGIPSFRLPRNIIEYEIDNIRKLGVEIKTDNKIKGPKALDKLLNSGYKAVFLAVGAHKGKKLGIPAEDDYEGVIDAISFLKDVNFAQKGKLGQKVVVIGGGNSAIDSARTAVRLGCGEVTIVYRRTREEMPANESEIKEAEEEGVKIIYLASPIELKGEEGRLKGAVCQCMELGKADSSGRPRPVPIPGCEFEIEADSIITAISQDPELDFLPENQDLEISKWQTLAVDGDTLATSRPGVFAGGDAVTGPNTVIDAIAAGHVAARSIERYLNGKPLKQELRGSGVIETEIALDLGKQKKAKRADMPMISSSDRVASFKEVELGFSEAAAISEAGRCLRCGPCDECFECVPECQKTVTILSSIDNKNDGVLFRLPQGFEEIDLRQGGIIGTLNSDSAKPFSVQMTSTSCYVKQEVCRGCGDCVTVCEYSAPMLLPKGNDLYVSLISENICKGCGTCVAICPSGAIVQNFFSEEWLEAKLKNMDASRKNVVVYTCSWHGLNLKASVLQKIARQDINILVVTTACAGRIEPSFIFKAFEHGAAGVLVVGCPQNECHYGFGNKQAESQFSRVQNMLNIMGFSSEKFQWAWPDTGQRDTFLQAVELFLSGIRENTYKGSLVEHV